MKKKLYFIFYIILLLVPVTFFGQVTIGSGFMPEEGAVLDLRTKETDSQGVNSNKGFLIPKVAITSLNSLIPFVASESSEIKAKHVGLVVYNQNELNNLKRGLAIWDGTTWKSTLTLNTNDKPQDGQIVRYDATAGDAKWSTINIPRVRLGEFYLGQTTTTKDMEGHILNYTGDALEAYVEDLVLNGTSLDWKEFSSLSTEIVVPEQLDVDETLFPVKNRLIFNLQTGAQADDVGASGTISREYAFALGIFMKAPNEVEYKLKQIRAFRLSLNSIRAFDVFTLFGSVDNLVPGTHQLKVAVKLRATNVPDTVVNRFIAVGREVPGAPNFSPFMAQTNLRCDLYLVEASN